MYETNAMRDFFLAEMDDAHIQFLSKPFRIELHIHTTINFNRKGKKTKWLKSEHRFTWVQHALSSAQLTFINYHN